VHVSIDAYYISLHAQAMVEAPPPGVRRVITAAQMRAARALLDIDQRRLAALAGVSLPTIQRMEASPGMVRGVIDSLMKVTAALEGAGIELIADQSAATGQGRGVRFRKPAAA
jgi:transcriptional regulator with XRE-family HTH domain